uniref:Uncharacterized protein n=1 Tax=Timema cristinae TaxID=61476 RepID=A0A7R9CV28_TIMCR|nr:unnamed protein product [Timema cristinae]
MRTGMKCDFDNKHNNLLSEFGLDNPEECPRAIDSRDKTFCCSKDGKIVYCCDAMEFAKDGWLGPMAIGLIAAAVIGVLIGFCICCFCCPCCIFYKRRHPVTV